METTHILYAQDHSLMISLLSGVMAITTQGIETTDRQLLRVEWKLSQYWNWCMSGDDKNVKSVVQSW